MNFHVIGIPHAQTTDEFPCCAFTSKIKGFCQMMFMRGHEVYLYSGDSNTFACTEHYPCFTEADRVAHCGADYIGARWDETLPAYVAFHGRVIERLRKTIKERDIICVVGGCNARPFMQAFPKHLVVEFGIGYEGVAAKFRVWESYAWMHACLGSMAGSSGRADGAYFDRVIPGYLDTDAFDWTDQKDDYFVFVGRMIERKGVQIAADACKAVGKRLVCMGPGSFIPEGVEYLGPVNHSTRNKIVRKAKALFCPTIYLEPFGNVAIEAAALGTPVISTDWGAFTETVRHGETGYRCRLLRDFVRAAEQCAAGVIASHVCVAHASQYDLRVIGRRYDAYFEDLMTLFDAGWYQSAA